MSLDEMAEKFRRVVQRVESGAPPGSADDEVDEDPESDAPDGFEGQDDDQDDDGPEFGDEQDDGEEESEDDGGGDLDSMRSAFQDIAQRAQQGGSAANTDPVDERQPTEPSPISPDNGDEDRNPASPPPSQSDPTAQAGALDNEPDGRLPDLPDDDQSGQPGADPAAQPAPGGAEGGTPGAQLLQRLGALVQRVTGGGAPIAADPAGAPAAGQPQPPAGQPGAAPGQPGQQPGVPGQQPGALPPGYKPGSKEVWDAVVQRLAAGGHPLTRATVEQTLVGFGHDRPRVVAEMSAVHPQHVHGALSDARKKMVDQTWGQLGKQSPTLPMQLGDVAVTPLISGPGLRRRRRRFQAVVRKHR